MAPYLVNTSYLSNADPFHEVKRKRDKKKEVWGNIIVASSLVFGSYQTFVAFISVIIY